MSARNSNLAVPFHDWSLRRPDAPALAGPRETLSYGEAAGYIRALAKALGPAGRPGARVAVLGSRSVEACLSLLAVCWTGATYVPLGLKLPEERLVNLMRASAFDAILADAAGEKLLTPALLAAAPEIVVLADRHGPTPLPGQWRLDGPLDGAGPAPMRADELAYVEYTSGTTGAPKGVMIETGAVNAYLDYMAGAYALGPDDRVAETTDLSFDVSVSNMFFTWKAGASLHILDGAAMFSAVKFVRERELTMWFSAPSAIAVMQRTKSLIPGCMPSLRWSFFAGEPLPAPAAKAWSEAAPHSVVDNLYGPTEATIVCIGQRFEAPGRLTKERDIVALGLPFPHMRAAIVDAALNLVPRGVRGELALGGPQLARGYWSLPDLTAARFPHIAGERWYLTGDHAVQDEDGVFHHLGRLDNQVKVRGNRVELEEVEVHLRRLGQTMSAAAVAWPVEHGSASGLVGFVAGAKSSSADITQAMRLALPSYMTPASIVHMDALPLNDNGKIDRKALFALLEEGRS